MKNKELPEKNLLAEFLRYDPETGDLFWNYRDALHFEDGLRKTAHQKASIWNGRYAGKPALAGINGSGYRSGFINSQAYVTHRVIWKLVYGEDPVFIDHINGDRLDNRIENLRSITKHENSLNQRTPKSSKSGVCGISWHKRVGKWCAKIRFKRKDYHLGYFSDMKTAQIVRKEAEIRFGFHENHGTVRNKEFA